MTAAPTNRKPRMLQDIALVQARSAHDQRVAESMTRGMKYTLVLGAVALLAIGAVLMLLLTQATHNQALYERQYARLFVVNAVVAFGLLAVILWVAARLIQRLRRGKFGSQLLVKIALIFALVGLLPGVLIYSVSYQFVSRSIESWFDVRVEAALDAGLNLGRSTLDALASESAMRVRSAAAAADWPANASGLERLREQLGATDVSLWSGQQQLLASAGGSKFSLNVDRPGLALLRQAQRQRSATQLDGLDDAASTATIATSATDANRSQPRIRVLVLWPDAVADNLGDRRFLQAVLPLPAALAANALAVQDANREYQERALARGGLKRMYIGTLTLSLFLSVFGAVLLAVLLGNQLVRPLIVLAAGVREVAEGDLRPKPALLNRDELSGLTRSFAQMTQQIADARALVDITVAQLSEVRERLQTILDNQSAAVLVLDADNTVRMANPAAARVLRTAINTSVGANLATVQGCEGLAAISDDEFRALPQAAAQSETTHWQRSTAMQTTAGASGHGDNDDQVHLLVRGAWLPNAQRLLVIDDITDVLSAQRAQAWGEVARRLAHEIKNPLTPIQLAAERLPRKFGHKLDAADAQVLAKSVNTIVDQVDSMKRLVNEFRDYGRLPAAKLAPLDLNALAQEVLQLYPEPAPNAVVRVGHELSAGPLWVDADAQQIRQVIHNLVQNAQESCEAASLSDQQVRHVWLRTALATDGKRVRLSVSDEGPGFSPALLKRVFEPYVTTKAKGTGLGLAVVKKIADDHHARVDVGNRTELGKVAGAQVSLSFAVAKLQHDAAAQHHSTPASASQ